MFIDSGLNCENYSNILSILLICELINKVGKYFKVSNANDYMFRLHKNVDEIRHSKL